MKVKIKNYQIIKDAELEFLPGITAIVGNSNNGKSSIIRAVEAAINNKGGNSFIRYDSDSCEVTIEDNNHTIIWTKHKKQSKSSYSIDGKVLNKIGQKQLDEVGQLLNMSEVAVNSERFRLNFWKQMDFPFLISKTPYQLFDFISNSSEQEIISELQDQSAERLKQLVKDLEYSNAQVDLKTKDIQTLEKDIANLAKFTEFNTSKFDMLVEIYNAIDSKLSTIELVNTQIEANSTVLKDASKKLENVSAKLDKIKTLYDTYNRLAELIKNFDDIIPAITKLNTDLAIIKKSYNNLNTKQVKLDQVLSKYNTLKTGYDKFILIEKELDEINEGKKTHQAHINEIDKKITLISDQLDEFNICPFCNSNLGGHSHE